MGASHLQVKISARPWIDVSAGEEQQTEHTDARWHVQVQGKDESAYHTFQLSDPFDSQQYAECRWYLDRFVQRSPYSVTRAAKAAEALNGYATSIVKQLRLRNLIEEAVNNDPLRQLIVEFVIEEQNGHDTTIHQLHWELLEDSSLWQPFDVQVTVTRLLAPVNSVPRIPTGKNQQMASSKSINLLLVVARDLSSGSDQYDDVDPSLATKILTNIQDQTRANPHSIPLNVEIVRPGTRAAMEKHLQYAQRTRGPGYFNLVHFDLHGEVDDTEQKAYLLFNSEDGSLQRESAQEVAEMLEQHSIPCVVLNACESARADCGEDANVAQIFQKESVNNVLAMSHKISSTAAEIFLATFYHSILLKRFSFPAAAQEARAALRKASERDARFGLRRLLLDYLVPVTYMSKSESNRNFDLLGFESNRASDIDLVQELFNKQKVDHLYGRGFDLLRLERHLQANQCVFMSGPAGVGKTALLLEGRKMWLKTRFVEGLCIANFSAVKITSSGEFVASMIAQLPLKESEKRSLTDQMNEIVSKPTFDVSELAALFLKPMLGRRCMFIFDDLHIAFTRWEDRILGFPGREPMNRINQFIGAIIKLSRETQYLDNVYLVFVDRVAVLPAKLRDFVPYTFEEISFPLAGLQMSDFMSLAQNILQKQGYRDTEWTNSELNELELALDLLQGIPGAACQVLPVVAGANVPRHQLRTFVHQGLCEATPALQENGFFKQLLQLSDSIKDGLFASLLMLSMYWHEGPDMVHFAATIASSGLSDDDDALTLILSLAFEQGYIAFTPDLESTVIHPMFTIYGRVIANSICKAAVTRSQKSSPSLFGRASRWVTSLVLPSNEKQELTATIVKAMWDGNFRDASKHTLESIDALRDRFLDSVAARSMSQWVSGHCKGTNFSDILSRWNSHLANLQTCISICLCTPPLPVEKWPLIFFQQQAAGIRMYGTVAQAALYAEELGRVFQTFIELSGGYALRPEYQLFGLSMSSCLAATYNIELRNPPKFEYYVQCGLEIAKQSEDKYGPLTDFNAVYMKGLIMRYKTLQLLEKGSQAEAEELWQSMLDLEESLWDGDHSRHNAAFSEEVTNALVANFSKDAKDIDVVKSHVQAISGRSVANAYYKSRKQSMQLIKLIGERRRQGVEFEKSREYKAVLMQAGLGMERTLNAFESTGVQDLDSDKRWWPENMDMLRHVRRYKNPRNRLDDLEEAQSSGNILAAAEHHQALLREALTAMDLDETGEHVDALERIYQQDPAFEKQLQGVQQSKAMFGSVKSLLRAVKGGSHDAGKSFLAAFAGHHEVLASSGAPKEVVEAFGINRQILAKDQELYGDESVASTGIGADTEQMILNGMQRMMANIGDPDFVAEFPRVGLAMMNHLKDIQDAELSQNLEAEQAALDKYEEFSKLPIARDMVDHAWIERRRKDIDRKIIWTPHLDKWTEAMSTANFRAAHASIEDMEHDQPDRWSSVWAWTKLEKIYQDTEKAHWNTVYASGMSKFTQGEFAKAAAELSELIDLHNSGAFSHLEPEGLAIAFYGVRTNQLLSRINIALRSSEVEKALELCNEWFNIVKDKDEAQSVSERNKFLDLKEACELQIHVTGYQNAVQGLKTADAMKHLMALYALSEQQAQTPDIERNMSTLLTKEMLNEWQQKILVLRMLQSFHSLTVAGDNEGDDGDQEAVQVESEAEPDMQKRIVTGKMTCEDREDGERPYDVDEPGRIGELLVRAFREATQRSMDAKTANISDRVAEVREEQ